MGEKGGLCLDKSVVLLQQSNVLGLVADCGGQQRGDFAPKFIHISQY